MKKVFLIAVLAAGVIFACQQPAIHGICVTVDPFADSALSSTPHNFTALHTPAEGE